MSGDLDSANYVNIFSWVTEYSLIELFKGGLSYLSHMEIGWFLYCKIITVIITNFQLFLAITALIEISLIGFVLYKYSKDIVLSFIVFFSFGLYIISFSGLRQSVAFSLTFFSYYYLMEKKNVKFVLTVILASAIHTSAFIFLIAYPLKLVSFTTRKSLLLLCLVFILLPVLSSLIDFIAPLLFGGRYLNFQDKGGAITLFLLYAIIFVFYIKLNINNEYDNSYRGIILMAVFCQSLGYIGSGAITRIGFYFTIFFTLLFPKLVIGYSSKQSRGVCAFIISLLLLTYFWLVNKDGYLDVIPYYFFWEKPYLY